MVSISISIKGKPTINCDFAAKSPNNVTVSELKAAVQAKFPKMVFNRQRLTLPVEGQAKPVVLADEKKTLADYGVSEGTKLRLKDLGPQVAYRWLYLWEYGGVIFLNPALFWLSQTKAGSVIPTWGPYQPSDLQYTVRNLIILHFLKRFYESAFLHTFSRPTVPLAYVFRNMSYYWGLVGILMPLTIYRPAYSVAGLKGSILNSPNWLLGWTAFILVCEALNFYSHYHLSTLRVPAGQPRKYPTGLGFGTVVCANYWYETLGVLGMVIMTGFDIGTVIYLAGAVFFMQLWAGQKYARYKREQDPKVFPGKRWKFFPPLY